MDGGHGNQIDGVWGVRYVPVPLCLPKTLCEHRTQIPDEWYITKAYIEHSRMSEGWTEGTVNIWDGSEGWTEGMVIVWMGCEGGMSDSLSRLCSAPSVWRSVHISL